MTHYLDTLDRDQLTDILRTIRGNDSRVREWHVIPISNGTSGIPVYRVEGVGDDSEGVFRWSVILKSIRNISRGIEYDLSDPFWKREALVYASGLLDDLPGGLRGPRCLKIVEVSEREIGLWLEDVGDEWSEKWSLERYGLAAYHLGQFNGSFVVGRRVPAEDWLGRNQWEETVDLARDSISTLDIHRADRRVAQIYSAELVCQLLQLWGERSVLIKRAYECCPLTFCHGDATGRNLFAVDSPEKGKETVAIDWTDACLAPIGEEAARFLGSSLHWFFRDRMSEAQQLSEAIFTGYAAGLEAVGWQGDTDLVRYTYHAAAGTIYGLMYTSIVDTVLSGKIEQWAPQAYGCTGSEAVEHRVLMGYFFVGMANEAKRLFE